MKKILLSLTVAVAALAANAQKDPFGKVREAFIDEGPKAANETFVKMIAKKPELANTKYANLWKARFFNEQSISQVNGAVSINNGIMAQAYDALSKYISEDAKLSDLMGDKEPNLGLRVFDALSNNLYYAGGTFFNQAKYDSALIYFEKYIKLNEVSTALDLKKNGGKIDTVAYLLAGASAQNAKNNNAALSYYKAAFDAGYDDPKDGPNMLKFVAITYTDLKDRANFDKYVALGEKLYPKENWNDYKSNYLEKAFSLEEALKAFTADDAAGKLNHESYTQYGAIFFGAIKDTKITAEQKENYLAKAGICFSKAYEADNKDAVAATNVGNLAYNKYIGLDDEYRAGVKKMQEINASKPVEKDPKKKAAIDAEFKGKTDAQKALNVAADNKAMAASDEALNWYTKAANIFGAKTDRTKAETSIYKQVVNNIINIYDYKKNKARGKDVKAYDAAELMFKKYDDMFSTIK